MTVFYHWVSSPKYVMMVHLNVNKEVKVRLNREHSNVLYWEINLTVILVTRKRNAVFLKNNKRQQVQREK